VHYATEQQGDVQAQPPREHLPPSSITKHATGCATAGKTSCYTASVSCGCSKLPNLVHTRRQWLVGSLYSIYGEGGDERAGQAESEYKIPQVKRLHRRRLQGASQDAL